MLTSLPAISSANASTTRARNSIEIARPQIGAEPLQRAQSLGELLLRLGQAADRRAPDQAGAMRAHLGGLIRLGSFGGPYPRPARRLRVRRSRCRARQAPAQQQRGGDQRRAPQERAVAPERLEQRAGHDRPEHPRQAADRLCDAHHFALFLGAGAARNQAVQRRLHRPHADRQRAPPPQAAAVACGKTAAPAAQARSMPARSATAALRRTGGLAGRSARPA